MSEICSICGLPKELCACETIAKENQKVIVSLVKKKFGKEYTVVEGSDAKQINMKGMIKHLKNFLACGGTAKADKIELQGDHRNKMKKVLIDFGFAPYTIEVR